MEPYSLSHPSFGMLDMDLSYNDIKHLDFSNFVLKNAFCKLDLSNNHITDLINNADFRIDVNIDDFVDGGMVLLNNNDFEDFFDFRSVGVTDIIQLGIFKDWGF